MTELELQRAQELKKNIDELRECVAYFDDLYFPEPNNSYKRCYGKFFWFKLFKKKEDNTICCQSAPYGTMRCNISVDKEFINYCRAYFEKKLEEAQAKFDDFGKE